MPVWTGPLTCFFSMRRPSSAALTQQGLLWRPLTLAVLIAWVVGAALFAGDVSARAFIGHRLFPMAAPTGGTILIAAWLALAIAALVGAFQRG
jgi:uncharacterized membrane protein YgdD (TMEM256/DUF423 family)